MHEEVATTRSFPGQYYDSETGHNYNINRDYSPSTGRYVESDPIGLDGGINTYTYSDNDPLDEYDPDGTTGAVPLPAPLPIALPSPTPEQAQSIINGLYGSVIHPLGMDLQNLENDIGGGLSDLVHCPNQVSAEHTNNKRPSTEDKHEKGKARKNRDRGGEKADNDRPYGPRNDLMDGRVHGRRSK